MKAKRTVEQARSVPASRVTEIDGLSQEACEEIEALAESIAATAKESPVPARRVRVLARIIGDRAFNLMNSINSMAEDVGANYRA